MNSFEILKGFSSDDVQEFVQKQKENQAQQARVLAQRKPARPAAAQAKGKPARKNQFESATTTKDVREHSANKGKNFDRSRIVPRKGARLYDRKNAPGKGSNRLKKGGSGAHNWGSIKDQAKAAEKEGKVEGEVVPKVGGEEPPMETEELPKVEEKPAEPEDNTITYEEFLKQKRSTKKESEVDHNQLREKLKKENLRSLQKGEEQEVVLAQKSGKSRSRKSKKEIVDLGSVVSDSKKSNSAPREFKKDKPYGKHRKTPNTNDENEFPSL